MSTFTRISLKLLLGLAAMVASAQAHAQACGATLYGSVTLGADVVCPAGVDALVIGDHNVRIDLNGFSIVGPHTRGGTTPWAAGVRSAGFDGLQIVGPGSITGFYFPIDIDGGDRHLVSEVTVGPEAGYSVLMRNSSDSVIELSRIPFLEIESYPGHRARANRIVDNTLGFGGIGVSLSGCDTAGNLIAGNLIHGGGGAGVGLHDGANDNHVLKNKILVGQIFLEGASNNLIESNLVDIEIGPRVGILMLSTAWPVMCARKILPSSGNIVRGNDVRFGMWGLMIEDYSYTTPSVGNKITRNTFRNQKDSALYFGFADHNDARGNRYINVPVIAYDYGVGNLWP